MNREKASPQTTQPPAHVIKCETAACCVYAGDDVTANGTAAKAGVSWPSARSRRTTWGWGGEERSAHDLSVQTMQGENWRERRGTEREVAGETYQSDDGGSGPGARHDVQVVGQVELEKRPAALVDCHVQITESRLLRLFELKIWLFWCLFFCKLRGLSSFSWRCGVWACGLELNSHLAGVADVP